MDNRRNSANDSQNSYIKKGTDINNRQNGKKQPAQKSNVQRGNADKKQNSPSAMTPEMIRAEKRKAAQKKMILNNAKNIGIILAVVITISLLIASVVISCVNDVLAIHISEKGKQSVSVEITEGMDTGDVIDALDDAGVIKNAWFCKLAAKFFGYTDDGYIARTYELNRSMGLENMLNEIKDNNSGTAKTVTLTFPEGYTADQIISMLEENNVCTREKFMEAVNTVDFFSDYGFLESVGNADQRYNKLEGYLFPDTYEFYIGEDPSSVIKKFLNNFDNKWTDDFDEKTQERRMTADQVIRLASIIEKEAAGADMPVVASILMNRLDAGMQLECDSTSNYIASAVSGLSADQISAYNTLYDTYICGSLPVGAICNPGTDAIEAVLNAPDTSYYYFMHDANNEFHAAKTLSEHENNVATYGLAQ